MSTKKATSALISVFHKDGLEPIVKKFDELGITIYSTGGTEKFIKDLGCKVGLAINPNTSIKEASKFLKDIDILLLMSVFPGRGGQKFINKTYSKIKFANSLINQKKLNVKIEIDGGVDNRVSNKHFDIGANILVSGSYVVKNKNKYHAVSTLKNQ